MWEILRFLTGLDNTYFLLKISLDIGLNFLEPLGSQNVWSGWMIIRLIFLEIVGEKKRGGKTICGWKQTSSLKLPLTSDFLFSHLKNSGKLMTTFFYFSHLNDMTNGHHFSFPSLLIHSLATSCFLEE